MRVFIVRDDFNVYLVYALSEESAIEKVKEYLDYCYFGEMKAEEPDAEVIKLW